MPVSRKTCIFTPSPPTRWQISTEPKQRSKRNSPCVAGRPGSPARGGTAGTWRPWVPSPRAELPQSHPARPLETPVAITTQDHCSRCRGAIASDSASSSAGSYPGSASTGSGQGEVNPKSHHRMLVSGTISPINEKEIKIKCTCRSSSPYPHLYTGGFGAGGTKRHLNRHSSGSRRQKLFW